MRTSKLMTAALMVLAVSGALQAQSQRRFKAVAFDYFVLFDPSSIVPVVEKEFPGKGIEFTRAWQSKQFEYAFLRSITGKHEDFFRITADAFDFTAESMDVRVTPDNRTRLIDSYLSLQPWGDTISALKKLKAAGIRVITIANFSKRMLRANADNAGVTELFEELLSTEVNRTFKPDPRSYELGLKRLRLRKDEVVFAAFGGWDVFGAKSFGYTTYWVNRFRVPSERLGVEPDGVSNDLDGLLRFVLGKR